MSNQRQKEKREMQFVSAAQAWRTIQNGRFTFEDVAQCPPDNISEGRWRAMLNNRKESEKRSE